MLVRLLLWLCLFDFQLLLLVTLLINEVVWLDDLRGPPTYVTPEGDPEGGDLTPKTTKVTLFTMIL